MLSSIGQVRAQFVLVGKSGAHASGGRWKSENPRVFPPTAPPSYLSPGITLAHRHRNRIRKDFPAWQKNHGFDWFTEKTCRGAPRNHRKWQHQGVNCLHLVCHQSYGVLPPCTGLRRCPVNLPSYISMTALLILPATSHRISRLATLPEVTSAEKPSRKAAVRYPLQ